MTTSIRVGWPPSSTSRLVDRVIRRRATTELSIAAERAIRRHLHLLSGRPGRRG